MILKKWRRTRRIDINIAGIEEVQDLLEAIRDWRSARYYDDDVLGCEYMVDQAHNALLDLLNRDAHA